MVLLLGNFNTKGSKNRRDGIVAWVNLMQEKKTVMDRLL